MLAQVAVGFFFSRRVKLTSRPVGDRRVRGSTARPIHARGPRTAPELAESPAVAVPVTLGVWHPVILLPTAWREWSEEKLQAVLAHELSHVVRRDALTRALAAIHRGVFWLAHWLGGWSGISLHWPSSPAMMRRCAREWIAFFTLRSYSVSITICRARQDASDGREWQ